MKKGILFVAFVGLLVTVVLAVAPLITGDSVAARAGTLVRTLTDDKGSSCEIELYADYCSGEVSGTVKTCTDEEFMTYTKVLVILDSSSPNDYGGIWTAEAYWGYDDYCAEVQIDSTEAGGDTFTGSVEVRWEVWYYCGIECTLGGSWGEIYREEPEYNYSYGAWADVDSGFEGLVKDVETGYPISGALVEAYQEDDQGDDQLMGYDHSGQEGQYQFDLPSGEYDLEASRTGYEDKTYYDQEVGEHEYTTSNFQLTSDTGIEGLVWDDDTGYPISYVLVKAYQGTQLMGSDYSAQDGQYQIDLPPGVYKVKASRPGYYNKTYYGVEVDEGYTIRNIQLDPTGFPIPI